jgi:hypothetical protein
VIKKSLSADPQLVGLTPRPPDPPLKETIGVKLDNLYRRMGIDVQQTFRQLDLSPINVLQTDRNIGLLSQENMFLTLLHHQVLRNDVFM